ncbi:unnamed protein product [Prorocentrum cordatum]|uniref:Uncharacterized protein n=1 Tax=Prorocentrum cordatum TaxID=2364126 RepID=A0ABN9V2M1_9DINO|nr:unnamed protein product [Polarella glacialis]
MSFPTPNPTSSPTNTPTSSPTAPPTSSLTSSPTSSPTSFSTPAPTLPSTSAATPPSSATGTGDPHLQNIHGERFDLMTPVMVTLVNIPRGKRVEDALLAVEADALRLGGHCADTYFQGVNITGIWADKLQARGFNFNAEGVQSHKVPKWTNFGPLVGEYDHADAARIPAKCRITISLRKPSRTSVQAELVPVAIAS